MKEFSMKSCEFTTIINDDWDNLITSLSTQEGSSVTTDPSRWNLDTPGYNEIYKLWKDANFNSNAIKWTNYYPGQHFPMTTILRVATFLEINTIRSWVSKVDPGYFAPLHWDVDDNEGKYLQNGAIKRYSIFIEKPEYGHIFILGDDYLYNIEQGSAIKWNNYKDWHSGINAGMTPKYMLHILGH